MSRVRISAAGGVGRITLARPEKKNALDETTAVQLREALLVHERDVAVRAVLLDAEGSDFCAGADLDALAGMLDADDAAHLRDAEVLGAVFTTVRAMLKPVVAAVRGRALAGGAGLATACDLVLAAESARFGYPEVRVGFVPAMVMTMLRRAAGEKRAFELVATGRLVDAREALAIGLVSRVVPDAELDAAAMELASQLAAAAPDALRLTKRLFHELDGLSFTDGIALGARTNVEARRTDDFRTGVTRFARRGKDPA